VISGNSNTYTFSYTHWLTDEIKTLGYPSGRVVTYGMDDAGRIKSVRAGGKTYATMTSEIVSTPYTPDGRLAMMKLGNGLWETRDYRVPGVTTTFMLGTSSGTSGVMALEYNYSGSANNGNLISHVIKQPGKTWTQSFTYDALNRIETASETGGFNLTYGCDRYGNCWIDPLMSTGLKHSDVHEPSSSLNFDATTNRLNVVGSTYDNAGNQTLYTPFALSYDAENRITDITSATSGTGSFVYDGDGHRVKKVWTPLGGSTASTYYVYDATGQVASEYSDQTPGAAATSYVFTDMLGSVRGVTSSAGVLSECYDYVPFGRMLSSSDSMANPRDTGCYPGAPDIPYTSKLPQKFTGKERLQEMVSALDYLGARYYSGPEGRFTSPDPLLNSGRPSDPQSWNRYAL